MEPTDWKVFDQIINAPYSGRKAALFRQGLYRKHGYRQKCGKALSTQRHGYHCLNMFICMTMEN